MSIHLIGVYGTLRKGYGNHRLLETSKFVGTGKTVEKLLLTQRGIPYLTRNRKNEHPEAISNVVIEIYEVDRATLPRLDALEGHPNWYYRDVVEVEMEDGSILSPEIYLNDQSMATPNPSGDFVNRV